MEIIEFPSVLLDTSTMEVVDTFQRFVTPKKFPVSPFCTELTGITQEQVDQHGRPFLEVLEEHQDWIRSHCQDTPVLLVTCGDWDLKTMLPQQCQQYKVQVPSVYRKWTNVKKPYSYRMNTRPTGMDGMLKVLKLTLDGRHHSGIDDSKNICKIVKELIKRGIVMEATGSLSPSGSYVDTTVQAGYK